MLNISTPVLVDFFYCYFFFWLYIPLSSCLTNIKAPTGIEFGLSDSKFTMWVEGSNQHTSNLTELKAGESYQLTTVLEIDC